MLNELSKLLNKISYLQLISLTLVGFIYLVVCKDNSVFTALIISGTTSFLYIQLVKLGSYIKIFALFGFPVRLLLIVPLCAILVHKLHSNLIALFIGFTFCQLLYFLIIYSYIKKQKVNPN